MTTPSPPRFYCHTCKKDITPVTQGPELELTCPTCHSDFIEEVEPDDPTAPSPPTPSIPAPIPQPQMNMPPFFQHMNDSQPQLLSIAQAAHQIFRMHPPPIINRSININNTNNNNNNNHVSRTPFQFQFNIPVVGIGAGAGGVPSQPIPSMFNFGNLFVGGGGLGGLAGNPGDYVFGNNFEQIVNQLFQNASHTGNPPAAKSAIDDLHKGQIDQAQVDNKADCAICKEEFTLGSEYIEMPCKHIFDKECILQWLAIHNSCPVCRHELKTDNPDYEARQRR